MLFFKGLMFYIHFEPNHRRIPDYDKENFCYSLGDTIGDVHAPNNIPSGEL